MTVKFYFRIFVRMWISSIISPRVFYFSRFLPIMRKGEKETINTHKMEILCKHIRV